MFNLEPIRFTQTRTIDVSVTANDSFQCLIYSMLCFGMIELQCCVNSTLELFNVIEV